MLGLHNLDQVALAYYRYSRKLSVCNTPNAINPVATGLGTPLLGCDVWEHSYYVDYRNRRPEYLEAFIEHLVDWEKVASDLEDASELKRHVVYLIFSLSFKYL